jgi:hypothetical protein
MVGLGRFELPTYGLGNRRSIHLSYSPINTLQKADTIVANHLTLQVRFPAF